VRSSLEQHSHRRRTCTARCSCSRSVNEFTPPNSESHAALVALDIADHRPVDAERHAREIITIGAMLLDLQFVVNSITGVDVLSRGVGTLEAVYVATGREREARVLLDSVVTASSRADQIPARPGVEGLQRAFRNPRYLRGARMEMVIPLLLRTCADPKQLLFGVDSSYRRTVAYARDTLARFPSERAYIDAYDGMLSMGAVPIDNAGGEAGLLAIMSHTIDRVVGGRRFESCASLGPMGSRF